jgi:hypothetical protein
MLPRPNGASSKIAKHPISAFMTVTAMLKGMEEPTVSAA